MKRILITLLMICVLLSLCACGDTTPTEKTAVSEYKSTGAYTDLGDEKLSWEGLDALPKKYAGMSTREAREAVVEFWYYCKTALWIPDAHYDLYETDKQDPEKQVWKRSVEPGQVYAGLPYKGSSTGSIYRLLDFMDEETGVVNVTEAGRYPLIFGGMCSSGCYWAWARVMNSADYMWCNDSVVSRGYLRVGPYTYDDNLRRYINDGTDGTDDICRENGEQVMYQSYAAMDIADGLITVWEKNGHTMMCSIAPYVEYNEDGTISGTESFLCVTEQGGSWEDGVSPSGIAFQYEYSKDKKFTFYTLYEKCYIPFTFAELIGTDPIEETEISFSHTEETITENQLFSAKVTCNYNISDIYVYVYDQYGNEVFKHAARAYVPSTRELKVHRLVDKSYTWGSLDTLDAKEDYTVKVEVQLGTGERPVVYQGKLILG